MATPSISPERIQRLKQLVIAALSLLAVRVLVGIVWEYRRYFPADFESAFLIGREETFFGWYSVAFYVHIVVGPPIILLATFLVATGRRPRFLFWHRWCARLLMLLVLAALVPSGLLMATRSFAGPVAGSAFMVLSIATAVTAIGTLYFARTRKFAAHQRWALRCFLLLISPLVLRVVSGLLIVTGWDTPAAYCWNAWLSWLLPLIAYELWMWARATDPAPRLYRTDRTPLASEPLTP